MAKRINFPILESLTGPLFLTRKDCQPSNTCSHPHQFLQPVKGFMWSFERKQQTRYPKEKNEKTLFLLVSRGAGSFQTLPHCSCGDAHRLQLRRGARMEVLHGHSKGGITAGSLAHPLQNNPTFQHPSLPEAPADRQEFRS